MASLFIEKSSKTKPVWLSKAVNVLPPETCCNQPDFNMNAKVWPVIISKGKIFVI
jgi:hypothetical protein